MQPEVATTELSQGTILSLILGPLGVLIVLVLAVWWLVRLFEKEQGKRETAYFGIIEMYKSELSSCNKRLDTLYLQINALTERIGALAEHNSNLNVKLEEIVRLIEGRRSL